MNSLTLTPTDSRTRPDSVDLELYLERLAQHEKGLVVDIAKPAGGAPHEALDWRGSSAGSCAQAEHSLLKGDTIGLENRYGGNFHRGFESPPLRLLHA